MNQCLSSLLGRKTLFWNGKQNQQASYVTSSLVSGASAELQ